MDNNGSKPLTFAEYIKEMGGSGVIYDDECHETMCSWKYGDWIHVDENIAPIVHQVLVDAAEVHPELYAKLMETIFDVYCELRSKYEIEQKKYERPKLTIVK